MTDLLKRMQVDEFSDADLPAETWRPQADACFSVSNSLGTPLKGDAQCENEHGISERQHGNGKMAYPTVVDIQIEIDLRCRR